MKKKLYLLPIIALLLGAIFAVITIMPKSTTAYLTDDDTEINILSPGDNKIEIIERFDPPEELKEGVNTFNKAIKIKNTGDVDCFVRVFVEFTDAKIRDISKVSPDGTNFYSINELKDHLPTGWVYEATGDLGPYYYYTTPIAPNESTPELIKQVKTTFESAIDVKPFDIIVYAESVQTLNNNGERFTGENGWRQAWVEFLD